MQNRMAFQVFKYMKLHDIPPDGLTYNIMIDCCGAISSSKIASMFLSMMLRDGFSPQKYTYKSLIKASFSVLLIMLGKDNYRKAYWLLYQMSSEGIQPDVVVFNAILKKAFMEGRLRIAELIVERMHRMKVQPDPETCYLLYHAYVRSQKHGTALEALQVLSMRMISEEQSVLQKNRKYFEDNFVLAEDSEAELRIIKIFKDSISTKHYKKEIFEDCGDYLATALLYLRWCALAGMSISWSPDEGIWAMSQKNQLETLEKNKKKEMKSTEQCKGKRRNTNRQQQYILIGALGKTLN
ncbi:hypothetical protein IFM89_021230 [Coptis chinensis]|uniref:Pentatricopeptide repeat-containing protein n=1 Tax=Coptis chinensis TaxID=261450 RepID=A0A835LJC2_9MAGN|nr:hypothetical protein IFM89_021230 [Coptis chinensis]